MKTSELIKQYLKNKVRATGNELTDYLQISSRAVRKQLANLLAKDEIDKIGRPPKVFYFIKKQKIISSEDFSKINKNIRKMIEENFLIITPAGERREGINGFVFWCQKTNQPVIKTATEYVNTLKKYNAFKKEGFIEGSRKIRATFPKVYLDKLFYLDFYSIERFGKTKLGQMLLYAKQSQNKKLIKELILDVSPSIKQLIRKYKIDGIGFIPPTVKREVQLMRELEKNLIFDARKISIIKAKTEVAVPQKTLNKLADRIENAKQTIIVDENKNCKNVLLIDDAVGSGATLNETAGQIKAKGICKGKIIGLAITGSFKGFDVISEV